MSNFRFKKVFLNNGIPVYLYCDPACKQVHFDYIVNYGSSGLWYNFENDGKKIHVGPGYAHYLEHLLGERSKNGNIYIAFKNRCLDTNAYTSMNCTRYYFRGSNEIKQSMKDLVEAMECPVFDDETVEQTRHAICREATTAQDKDYKKLFAMVQRNLFGGVDLFDDTLCTIGNSDTTKLITTERLYDCYNAFYTDNNKVLVVAGNVDEKEIIDYLNELYSNIPNHKSSLILPQYDMEPIRTGYQEIERDVNVDMNCVAFKVKAPEGISNMDLYFGICSLQDYLLDGETPFIKYVKEHNLFELMSFFYDEWHQGYFTGAQGFVSNNPEEYVKLYLDKLNEKRISPEEFELIKKSYIANELRKLEDKYCPAEYLAYTLPYSDNYTDLEYYKGLTYERYMEILNSLDFSAYTVGKIRQLSK